MPMVLRDKSGAPKAFFSDSIFYNSHIPTNCGDWGINPVTNHGTAYIIHTGFTTSNNFVGMGVYINIGDYYTKY